MARALTAPKGRQSPADLKRVPSQCYTFLGRSKTKGSSLSDSPRYLASVVISAAPLLILVATILDRTFSMDNGAKGLSQHYGFWVIFSSTPLLILLAGHLLDSYNSLIQETSIYLEPRATRKVRRRLRNLINQENSSLCLETRSKYVLYFGFVVGLLYSELNVIKLFRPLQTYGHDVFDSWVHPWGYTVTKIYLVLVLIWIYPIAIFIAAHVTWSTARILRFLCANDALKVDLFHHDNCGGTSRFGYLNFLVMGIYVLLFSVLLGMYLTHQRTYFVTQSALVFCSICMITQSVIGVYSIHRFVSAKKEEHLHLISKRLGGHLEEVIREDRQFTSDFLTLREHLVRMHTFPYAGKIRFFVDVLRYAPGVLAVVGVLLS